MEFVIEVTQKGSISFCQAIGDTKTELCLLTTDEAEQLAQRLHSAMDSTMHIQEQKAAFEAQAVEENRNQDSAA